MTYKVINGSFNDSPDGTALVVFSYGCNMRCPYCHNREFINPRSMDKTKDKVYSFDEIIKLIYSQKDTRVDGQSFLHNDWLILSGGEPLLQEHEKIHGMVSVAHHIGMKTGVWSNGTILCKWNCGERLDILVTPLMFDFINIDYKSTPDFYESYGSDNVHWNCVDSNLLLFLHHPKSNMPNFQITTVLCKPYITLKKMGEMCEYLQIASIFNNKENSKITWRWVNFTPPAEGCLDTSLSANNRFKKSEIINMKEKCFDGHNLGKKFILKVNF
jgi:pyruvate formate lyase activating enzyme